MTEIPDAIAGVVGGLAVTTVQGLLGKLPAGQRDAAEGFLAEYGASLFEMTVAQIWEYIRRMQAGYFQVIPEILSQLSDDEFLTKVSANTDRWKSIAGTAEAQAKFTTQLILRLIPIVGAILAALVGL